MRKNAQGGGAVTEVTDALKEKIGGLYAYMLSDVERCRVLLSTFLWMEIAVIVTTIAGWAMRRMNDSLSTLLHMKPFDVDGMAFIPDAWTGGLLIVLLSAASAIAWGMLQHAKRLRPWH